MAQLINGERIPPRASDVEPLADTRRSARTLSVPLTDFIGRPSVIEALHTLLREGATRLVTLTGPGGAGKTRLALQIARDLNADLTDGVAFVPLAATSDPELIPSTVAHALGLRLDDDNRTIRGLSVRIQNGSMLLVVDNFEHLLPASPFIAGLLRECPELTVLATSRAPLRLSGEHIFPVPPMSETEAVQLFVARARAANAEFALTDKNAGDVAAICRRLDGLPLAIELAAARVGALPVRTLLARLEPRLPLLCVGPRDAPERLQTMRNAIDWGYQLLASREQMLLRRLAVFDGGCTLEAAEAVAGDGLDVVEGLTALVAGSMVLCQEGAGDEPRYLILETIREFALEQLGGRGEEASIRTAHASYYLDLVERAWPHWSSPNEPAWIAIFNAEHDNIRAALAWLTRTGSTARGLRLIGALWPYWSSQDLRNEGQSWLNRALEWSDGNSTEERVRVLTGAAALNCALFKDHVAAGVSWCEEGLAIADEIGDTKGALQALICLANAALVKGDFSLATSLLEAGLGRIHVHGTSLPNAACAEIDVLGWLGLVALNQDDDARAERLTREVLNRKKQLGYTSGMGSAMVVLAVLAYRRGDFTRATSECQEGLRLSAKMGGLQTTLFLLDRLAIIAGEVGQAEHAARLGGQVEHLHELLTTLPNPAEQPDRDRAVVAARARLGDDAFAAAWTEGRRMRLEDAVAIGLAIVPSDGLIAQVGRRRLPPRDSPLTAREREVLNFVANGQTDQQIAGALFLSRRTINAHMAHILTKLDVKTRREAVICGERLGLLEPIGGADRYT